MTEQFIPKRFNAKTRALIDSCNAIIAAYMAQGYDLSLRQLYYQLVTRNVLPNEEKSYKRLSSITTDARYAGAMDWAAIRDRGRETVENSHWASPREILNTAARTFRIDLWADQPVHVEVMVEKQALEGVLLPVCTRLDVPFTANKGYSSSSALYEAGGRLYDQMSKGKRCVVVYLGDHDPSGIDMTRDLEDRLLTFTYDGNLQVDRIALNIDQVSGLNVPENPTKVSDPRAGAYIQRFGSASWELDAI